MPMKKGMSLATDTIIYIILGVLVLTVLLFFFTKNSGEAGDATKLQLDRGTYCSTYVQYDTDCDPAKIEQASNTQFVKAQTELKKICPKINPALCTGSLTQACLQNCCLVCPRR